MVATGHRKGRSGIVRRVRPLLAAACVGMVATLASCTAPPGLVGWVPQAVVNVPGSFTFTTLDPNGAVYGRIYLCTDTRTIVRVQADYGFFALGPGYVSWNGAPVPVLSEPGRPFPTIDAAFGPVDPGCGDFLNGEFYADPIPVPNPLPPSITFSFTTCDPNGSLGDCIGFP